MMKLLALCAALLSLASASHAADCKPAPLGDATLYLRGGVNNWAAADEYAFEYRCDAYFLNLKASGVQEFKLADEDWTDRLTFGGDGQGNPARGGAGNIRREFSGEHTLRLSIAADGSAQLSVGPLSFKPTPPAPLTDKVALRTRFDSRDTAFKQPFGAQPAGTDVSFSIGNDMPGLKAATLVIERRQMSGNQEQLAYEPLARIPMTPRARGLGTGFSARYRFDAAGVYGYWFEIESAQGKYALQNNKDAIYWTREKGSMGPATVERLPANLNRVRRYRQTIHAADFQVPAWARDVVYYYVFPERFRNGDASNDPRPGGGRPQDRYQDRDVERHARWNEKPFKPGTGDGSDALFNNDFFGGDLQGLIDKLDYIKALGANALYLTPVFRAPSNHKYDAADYKQIDPAFGSNADFERLCAEAAKRGIRVIPDTSLNHVGADSPYFNRFGNFPAGGAFDNGKINPASPYASWFKFKPDEKDPNKQFQGWVGVSDLPELDKNDPSWRAYAYRDPDSVTNYWLDRGAAGWRMDVAPWVPDDFWREWRSAVKAKKPDALTVAETWFDSSKYFLGDMFDSTMNYIFRNAVLDYAAGKSGKLAAANLELMREAYPPQAFSALMNLLSTHDQPRALHHFGEDRDLPQAKRRLLLSVFFQMTYPGAPTIYYGDEVGLGGGDDPYNRAPYPWADQGGQPDEALLREFKRLVALRHELPVLRHGTLSAPLHADDHVLVLARQLGPTWALTATNNSLQPRTVHVTLPAGLPRDARFTNALDGGKPLQARRGRLTLTLAPLSGLVLTR
ncbi:alpha-amylase family glycosyl hydrolase [Pelomonas sp. UHG3]|uniref:Alpha-amylase family glycosyl hydrolase n=1 Tax=Roseateles hydrophilus TaxID=2975054 RepID=A0ACC6C716_9BURK|nr:alpha-amylase family glycosyl hydrolase [Pelomonas sp. UHG3]MCY4744180.1 alpha-amylase family glycosyl hydrolase [Pelomonas sp. UHG3]